jgi:hypothetical protein
MRAGKIEPEPSARLPQGRSTPMVSMLHEALLLLFRNRPRLAPELLTTVLSVASAKTVKAAASARSSSGSRSSATSCPPPSAAAVSAPPVSLASCESPAELPPIDSIGAEGRD